MPPGWGEGTNPPLPCGVHYYYYHYYYAHVNVSKLCYIFDLVGLHFNDEHISSLDAYVRPVAGSPSIAFTWVDRQ